MIRRARRFLAIAVATTIAAGCSSDDDGASTDSTTGSTAASTSAPASASTAAEDVTLSLVTYDSFPTEGTTLNDALARFTESTGIGVEILVAGDAGTMVSKAALTAGNPEGDVMFGVDNTLLSRAVDAGVFEPYASTELGPLAPPAVALVPAAEATPIDFGDVCVNYDIAWFAEHDLDPPTTLADLVAPEYADLLVVEDPAASSPGLAFLLASIAEFGDDGWQDYWADLRANGVEVVESWSSAYYERFSGSSGAGPRPLVVSYGTSPPAEVLFAEPPRTDAPTAVIADTCFRQVEFAGILRGTDHLPEAQALIDFLAGPDFQAEIALNLFVYPARTNVGLPPAFTEFGVQPADPYMLAPADIAEHREEWVDEWTQIVLR